MPALRRDPQGQEVVHRIVGDRSKQVELPAPAGVGAFAWIRQTPIWSSSTERREHDQLPSAGSPLAPPCARPTVAPVRSIGWAVVMKRVPSLATQCGSMRWAR